MFTKMISLPEADLLSYGHYKINTQCLPNTICFAETTCLPAICVSTNNLKESALLPTEHYLASSCQLPFINQSRWAEGDTSLWTTCSDNHSCWAEREFCHAQLGDVRRVKRLIQLAQQRGDCLVAFDTHSESSCQKQQKDSPNASIPQACCSHASTKAAYRFYDNDAIEPSAILCSHQEATTERLSEKSLVLAVQDTTELDYTHIVSVGDREADVYELFDQAKQLSQDILIRASWNRCEDWFTS